MIFGFLWRSSGYRQIALGVFGVCLVRLAIVDVWRLTDTMRGIVFATLGACLVGVTFLYARFADQFKKSVAATLTDEDDQKSKDKG